MYRLLLSVYCGCVNVTYQSLFINALVEHAYTKIHKQNNKHVK